jgi:hypothetical protein
VLWGEMFERPDADEDSFVALIPDSATDSLIHFRPSESAQRTPYARVRSMMDGLPWGQLSWLKEISD